jgi:hypothetical protein
MFPSTTPKEQHHNELKTLIKGVEGKSFYYGLLI